MLIDVLAVICFVAHGFKIVCLQEGCGFISYIPIYHLQNQLQNKYIFAATKLNQNPH